MNKKIGWTNVKFGKHPQGIFYESPEELRIQGGGKYFVTYANDSKMETFNNLVDAKKFVANINQKQKNFEVYFQYNKTGVWTFDNIHDALEFANKHYENKPIIYHLARDDIIFQYDKRKSKLN